MASNISEAITETSKELNISKEKIMDEDVVMEVECMDDHEEFSAYEDKDGNIMPEGTAVGYDVFPDGQENEDSAYFVCYDQYSIAY